MAGLPESLRRARDQAAPGSGGKPRMAGVLELRIDGKTEIAGVSGPETM
jgi:hypothetical protein